MENSEALSSTESFSHSWLTHSHSHHLNLQPTFCKNSYEFNFDVPVLTHLVHADDIFSDGQIKPSDIVVDLFISHLNPNTFIKPPSADSVPPSPVITSTILTEKKYCYYILGKWGRSSKKLLHKCFRLVKPVLFGKNKTTSSLVRKNSRVDDLLRKVFEVRSGTAESPRPSSAYSVDVDYWSDCRKMDSMNIGFDVVVNPSRSSDVCWDAENSISEAILYCKRSIEK